jgi:hypothetical protein
MNRKMCAEGMTVDQETGQRNYVVMAYEYLPLLCDRCSPGDERYFPGPSVVISINRRKLGTSADELRDLFKKPERASHPPFLDYT